MKTGRLISWSQRYWEPSELYAKKWSRVKIQWAWKPWGRLGTRKNPEWKKITLVSISLKKSQKRRRFKARKKPKVYPAWEATRKNLGISQKSQEEIRATVKIGENCSLRRSSRVIRWPDSKAVKHRSSNHRLQLRETLPWRASQNP